MKNSNEKRPYDSFDFIDRNTRKDRREGYRYGDLYSMKDHGIVRAAVQEVLNEDEQEVIINSFWNGFSIAKIASRMAFNELMVRQLHSSALRKIRAYCLGQSGFNSRLEMIQDQAA